MGRIHLIDPSIGIDTRDKKKKSLDDSPTRDFLDHLVGEKQHCL